MPQTSMTSTRIAILGGGLSGLMAARALHRQGIHDFVLLEARSALGGRITSFQSPAAYTPTTAALHRFDLGPSWYWPDFQPDLHALIEHLGLATFAQFDEGDMVIEQSVQSAPMRVPGYAQSPASMRLLGGTEALVDALNWMVEKGMLKQSPLKQMIAAVSVGMYQGEPVLDLDYLEDFAAETDLNVVMTSAGGFIEVQGTAEGAPFQPAELNAMLALAHKGVSELFELQQAALAD